ncbi:MAG: type II toxin-antitoxin system PemK/MazF family toxin [Bacillota bacterium]|nr:type II toxin-antitoxin system PemK/MazF family toxin [Bacillota bacterium]
MVLQGEFYVLEIDYEDEDGSKERPVLVLIYEDNMCTIVPTTSQPPEDPPVKYFDKAKEPIYKWKEYGLDEMSYLKCANIKVYDSSALNNKKPIGIMDEDEFDRITEKICWYL